MDKIKTIKLWSKLIPVLGAVLATGVGAGLEVWAILLENNDTVVPVTSEKILEIADAIKE